MFTQKLVNIISMGSWASFKERKEGLPSWWGNGVTKSKNIRKGGQHMEKVLI